MRDKLNTVAKNLEKRAVERDYILGTIEEANNKIASTVLEKQKLEMVRILLQTTSEKAKQLMSRNIEDLVKKALDVIYGGKHDFKVVIENRRGQHEVDFYFNDGQSDNMILKRPFVGVGGGKLTIIALAIHLAVAEQTGIKGPIFLDEISKYVDSTAVLNVAYFLKEYSTEFNRQIIMVTHHSELAEVAGQHINIKKVKGDAIAEVVE